MSSFGTLSGTPARFDGGLQEVAPRTWAWIQPNGDLGESNAGLVVGDGASLLVDTLWDAPLTRRMLDAMAPLTADAPLRHAFNTHADGDHWWGNADLPPSCEVLATAACTRAMHGESPPRVLAALTRTAGLLRRVPGRTGAVARRAHAQFSPFDFGGVRRRYPDRTVADGAEIDVGGRVARIHEIGPAHTANDAIVHVPDAGVVFAADMLFAGVAPIMWHGPVANWIGALDLMLSLDADAFVPGHGPVCGRAEVERMKAYWLWLGAAVHEQRAAGRSAGEAAKALGRSPEHEQWADWLAPERIHVSVATLYRNLDGRKPEVAPPVRARLLVETAMLGLALAAER
jgi:cyclase